MEVVVDVDLKNEIKTSFFNQIVLCGGLSPEDEAMFLSLFDMDGEFVYLEFDLYRTRFLFRKRFYGIYHEFKMELMDSSLGFESWCFQMEFLYQGLYRSLKNGFDMTEPSFKNFMTISFVELLSTFKDRLGLVFERITREICIVDTHKDVIPKDYFEMNRNVVVCCVERSNGLVLDYLRCLVWQIRAKFENNRKVISVMDTICDHLHSNPEPDFAIMVSFLICDLEVGKKIMMSLIVRVFSEMPGVVFKCIMGLVLTIVFPGKCFSFDSVFGDFFTPLVFVHALNLLLMEDGNCF